MNTAIVYNNIFNFMPYRELIPIEQKMSDDEFNNYIHNNEYIIIPTVKSRTLNNSNSVDDEILQIRNNMNNKDYDNKYKLVFIVLFSQTSKIQLKTQDFKKVYLSIKYNQFNYDIIFVSTKQLNSHINNFINSLDTNTQLFDHECLYKHDLKFCNCNKKNIYTYEYINFGLIIPNHIAVPKYRILPKDEEIELLEQIRTKKSNLPKIKRNDPMVIWSHGIIGNVVEIERNDLVSSVSMYYRVII